MKRAAWPVVSGLVAAGLAAGISKVSGLGFWWALLIVAFAIGINGFIATLEDDLPGGFNNPDGTATPRYAKYVGWVLRSIIAIFLLVAVALIGVNYWGTH